jgi:hypothetical protein
MSVVFKKETYHGTPSNQLIIKINTRHIDPALYLSWLNDDLIDCLKKAIGNQNNKSEYQQVFELLSALILDEEGLKQIQQEGGNYEKH